MQNSQSSSLPPSPLASQISLHMNNESQPEKNSCVTRSKTRSQTKTQIEFDNISAIGYQVSNSKNLSSETVSPTFSPKVIPPSSFTRIIAKKSAPPIASSSKTFPVLKSLNLTNTIDPISSTKPIPSPSLSYSSATLTQTSLSPTSSNISQSTPLESTLIQFQLSNDSPDKPVSPSSSVDHLKDDNSSESLSLLPLTQLPIMECSPESSLAESLTPPSSVPMSPFASAQPHSATQSDHSGSHSLATQSNSNLPVTPASKSQSSSSGLSSSKSGCPLVYTPPLKLKMSTSQQQRHHRHRKQQQTDKRNTMEFAGNPKSSIPASISESYVEGPTLAGAYKYDLNESCATLSNHEVWKCIWMFSEFVLN